jgi:hypothetical protein
MVVCRDGIDQRPSWTLCQSDQDYINRQGRLIPYISPGSIAPPMVGANLRDAGPYRGLMKSRACTRCAFIPILLHDAARPQGLGRGGEASHPSPRASPQKGEAEQSTPSPWLLKNSRSSCARADGRNRVRSTHGDKIGVHRQADRLTLLGMELASSQIVAPDDGGEGIGIIGLCSYILEVLCHGVVRMDEVD